MTLQNALIDNGSVCYCAVLMNDEEHFHVSWTCGTYWERNGV